MKHLITLCICLLMCGTSSPQGGEGETFPDNELNIQVQNAQNTTITFEFIPIGANWAISTGCNIYLYNDESTYISTLEVGSAGYVDCWYNGYEYRFYNEGNYTSISDCADSSAGLKPLRNGFYRMNIYDNAQLKTYCYFDWRDTGFPKNVCRFCSGSNDMTIRYHGENEVIWFWNTNSIKITNQNPHAELSLGEIITWVELNCTPRTTTYLEDFWENALVVIEDPDEHPRFAWGKFPGNIQGTIIGYRIYRSANHIPGQPGTFSLFATVNEDEFEYKDETSTVGNDYRANSYYIKCIYTDDEENIFETSATNTVEIRLQIPQKQSAQGNNKSSSFSFSLDQNYPNPFNPKTKIIYAIEKDGLVTLKVFDILGNEVATLVKEPKQAGYYSVEFNASSLPSGIYFYNLTSGEFTSTKKLILLK